MFCHMLALHRQESQRILGHFRVKDIKKICDNPCDNPLLSQMLVLSKYFLPNISCPMLLAQCFLLGSGKGGVGDTVGPQSRFCISPLLHS
jgi:hypothetical protein